MGRLNDFYGKTGQRYTQAITPDRLERICGALALVLLGFVIVAVLRGRPFWPNIPWIVWAHLATISTALAITPVMMWRRRGDGLHRQLGWVWAVCMFTTALLSFGVRLINRGGFSPIHILSAITVISVPVLIIAARRRDIARHRGNVRGLIVGALLIAGFFTFPFGRLLGGWLFGTLHG